MCRLSSSATGTRSAGKTGTASKNISSPPTTGLFRQRQRTARTSAAATRTSTGAVVTMVRPTTTPRHRSRNLPSDPLFHGRPHRRQHRGVAAAQSLPLPHQPAPAAARPGARQHQHLQDPQPLRRWQSAVYRQEGLRLHRRRRPAAPDLLSGKARRPAAGGNAAPRRGRGQLPEGQAAVSAGLLPPAGDHRCPHRTGSLRRAIRLRGTVLPYVFRCRRRDALVGYNFALGGGLGMTHNKPETYPRLATLTAFVEPDDLVRAVEAVIKLQRDHGDRSDRKRARLKYLIDDRGLDWIKSAVESYFGGPLAESRPMPPLRVVDHMGWHDQGDGRWYLGIPVESGRIRDGDEQHRRRGLRDVIPKFGCNPILMPSQDILLSDIAPEMRASIERELRNYGITLASDITPVRRWALACPALPTCGLALTEAERVQQPLVANIEGVLERYGPGRGASVDPHDRLPERMRQ